MTLMAKYHKKKADYEKQYRSEPSILIRSYKIILTHNPNPAYLHYV